MGRLAVGKVRSLRTPGRYGDGGTLFLVVAPGGSRSWVQRLTVDGRRHDIGLGGFPLVTLAEARDQAFENRRLARRGGDPLAHKRRARVPTFEDAATRAREANRGGWRHAKTAANWDTSLAKYAHPVFGDRRVDQIGPRGRAARAHAHLGRPSPRSDGKFASASARRWPGRRRMATSSTTSPARPSTPRCRRRGRSRRTSGHCRTGTSLRRSRPSRHRGLPCQRRRACGSSC